MKYLVGIPMLYGASHCKEAIESVIHNDNVDLLIIDNGANKDVRDMLNYYYQNPKFANIKFLINVENIYVNPAWNQIINHFLKNDYDYLLIMNSDLVLNKDWVSVLDFYLNTHPDNIPIPIISSDKNIFKSNVSQEETEVHEGTPGVLIVLNKKHAELIYPIPESIKVWFGDNWIYEGLRKKGFKTMVLNNLLTYHSGSQTVSRVKGISELIEQDKIEWAKLVAQNS